MTQDIVGWVCEMALVMLAFAGCILRLVLEVYDEDEFGEDG